MAGAETDAGAVAAALEIAARLDRSARQLSVAVSGLQEQTVLDEFLTYLASVDSEEYGNLTLTGVAWNEDAIDLRPDLYNGMSATRERWLVSCTAVYEYQFTSRGSWLEW